MTSEPSDILAAAGKERVADRRAIAAETYQIAYDEAKRSLDEQGEDLSGLRTRALQYLAIVVTATAFLVGAGLKGIERHLIFYLLSAPATAMFALTLGSVVLMLIAWPLPAYRLSSRLLVDQWIENEAGPPTEGQLTRELAIRYGEMHELNAEVLRKHRRAFRVEVVLGALQLVLWASVVWIVG
jgi:hypothetical protein